MEKQIPWLKSAIVFLGVLAVRLMPLRAPNVEPILAAVMPLSKRGSALLAVVFPVLSIVLYDLATAGIGSWTFVPALTYGIVGAASYAYFRTHRASTGNFVGFSIAGILFFDAVTGVIAGPLLYGQSFAVALAGQIPFTALHLVSGVVFAALVSPVLHRWLATEEVFALAPKPAEIR